MAMLLCEVVVKMTPINPSGAITGLKGATPWLEPTLRRRVRPSVACG
jgi:hypothetical protein